MGLYRGAQIAVYICHIALLLSIFLGCLALVWRHFDWLGLSFFTGVVVVALRIFLYRRLVDPIESEIACHVASVAILILEIVVFCREEYAG